MDASAKGFASPWLFCTINLNREKGVWSCEWLDDLRYKHHTLHEYPCFYALQQTENWTTSAMNVHFYMRWTRKLWSILVLLADVFNAPDNLGNPFSCQTIVLWTRTLKLWQSTLHRLENRSMGTRQLTNLGWRPGNVNVHADALSKAVNTKLGR